MQTRVRRFALPVAASVGGVALVAWLAVFNNPFAPQKENSRRQVAGFPAAPTQLPPSGQRRGQRLSAGASAVFAQHHHAGRGFLRAHGFWTRMEEKR